MKIIEAENVGMKHGALLIEVSSKNEFVVKTSATSSSVNLLCHFYGMSFLKQRTDSNY